MLLCEARLRKADSEKGPGPGDTARSASVRPTRQPLQRGARTSSSGEARTMGCRRPSPRSVHPPDESAAGSAGWRPRLPGPGRWEKPSSRCSGFLLLSRPGLSSLPRLLSVGPAARGPRLAGSPGSQASSRGEAKDSALLSSRDAGLLEPPERPEGSPASSSVWREDPELLSTAGLSSCSGGLRPLVELCVEPAGLCGRCTGRRSHPVATHHAWLLNTGDATFKIQF